ncbi:MAG: hypothetical protein ONB05_09320, partial [candidate division KSB1 bacterium]|nr:hypothetical protein [candidate division KSB1 bacterium]
MRISVFSRHENGQHWLILSFIAILGFSTSLFLQFNRVSAGGRPFSDSNLVIDHATFMSNENMLEVSCQFNNRDLQFLKQGERFVARFLLSVFLFDLNGNKVAERSYQDSVA